MSKDIVLEARSVSKQFPGVNALSDVSFNVRAGEIHALVGENGAGKSTLIKIISGLYKADKGTLYIDGEVAEINTPRQARERGVATVYQELSLVESLTVAENIFMGRLPKKNLGLFVDWKRLRHNAAQVIGNAGMHLNPDTIVGSLSVGFRQQVEIARALSLNTRIVIFDEPTAVLTSEESQILFKNLAELKNRGIGIIYISHRMEEILDIADRITILRDGKYIKTLNHGEASQEEVIKLMVGRNIDKYMHKRDSCVHDIPILQVEDVSRLPEVNGVSFSVCRGEILGMYGLIGAGRTELVRLIFGLDRGSSGTVRVNGIPLVAHTPRESIEAGVGFLPEDRRRQGLILTHGVLVNNNLANHKAISRFGFFHRQLDTSQAMTGVKLLDIKTAGLFQKVVKLSGGNQQKVILSRWLTREPRPKLLILDEPTRGVDVGAKNEIHRLIRSCAEEGMAVLMISSDMHEILTVSDRIIVMKGGSIAGEMPHDEASEERIIVLAAG